MGGTTGRVVSTLGVLTVLSHNFVEENHLPDDERRAVGREMVAILNGQRGVHPRKVIVRSAERCSTAVLN